MVESSVSRSGRFIAEERKSGTHGVGGEGGLQSRSEHGEKENAFFALPGIKPLSSDL
jgi:hypothetical protein